MKKYKVIVKATITKEMIVEAGSEDIAESIAQDQFNIENDDCEERYTQETISIEEVLI